MNTVFDDVALAVLAVDCNLKNYQLKRVFKHFTFTTGCKSSIGIDGALKHLAANTSNRKWSDKSQKVSFNYIPTLDTQTVPIAAKKKKALITSPPQFCD
jgi:hypothetical protein